MTNKTEILTPVGRLVGGSLYEPQTTDVEGKPLTIRHGVNAGQPRVEYFFAIALPKGHETHWNQTEWGAKIWEIGHKGFPGGQANSPHFAWKVQDGDNNVPNRVGRKNCDREGYPGHWVLHFTSGFAPGIYTNDGTRQITDKDYVNLGDYIQVYGNCIDNGSQQQPGVFLNHQMVAFAAYGDRIVLGVDPKAVGFGKSPLPMGARTTPASGGFNPQAPMTAEVDATLNIPMAASNPPPLPYPGILQPPMTPPARVMLPKANGCTYEQMIANGWTDILLIQHGMMQG